MQERGEKRITEAEAEIMADTYEAYSEGESVTSKTIHPKGNDVVQLGYFGQPDMRVYVRIGKEQVHESASIQL